MKYEYVLKRSARRKSIGISLLTDNTIVVSAPLKTAVADIEKFITEKSAWLDKHIAINDGIDNRFSAVKEGKAVLVKGNPVDLIKGNKNSFSSGLIVFTSPEGLKKMLVKNVGGEFFSMLDEISKATGLRFSKAAFRSYKSRWGCCNRKKELYFNYKLLMLPQDIWVYLIVHELSHTLHMNHSASFWNCVASYLPDYKARRKKLREYSFVCSMY